MMEKLQPPRLALGLVRFIGVFPGECKLLVAVGERPEVCLLLDEGVGHEQIERGRSRKPSQTFLGNLRPPTCLATSAHQPGAASPRSLPACDASSAFWSSSLSEDIPQGGPIHW